MHELILSQCSSFLLAENFRKVCLNFSSFQGVEYCRILSKLVEWTELNNSMLSNLTLPIGFSIPLFFVHNLWHQKWKILIVK